MTWYFHNTPIEFTENDIGDAFGFVYIISHKKSGRKYIGKKFFTKSKTKQLRARRKSLAFLRLAHLLGSNKELQADVLANGESEYTREIIHVCKTRSECSYLETWEIFKRHALLNESYYNAWVTCKIHKAHLGGLHNKSL